MPVYTLRVQRMNRILSWILLTLAEIVSAGRASQPPSLRRPLPSLRKCAQLLKKHLKAPLTQAVLVHLRSRGMKQSAPAAGSPTALSATCFSVGNS